MTRPFFTRDRISHFELFERHAGTKHYPPPSMLTPFPVDHAIAKIKERHRDGYAIDFQVSIQHG